MARTRGVLAVALAAAALAGLPLASEAQPAAQAELSVAVEAPGPSPVGSPMTFEIVVANEGADAEPDARLEVVLPDGVVLASSEPSVGACEVAAEVTCALGELEPGGTAEVVFEATPVDPGALEGTAALSGAALEEPPAEAPILLEATGQPCTVEGTEGDDELVGTEDADVLCGLGGDDVLRGLGGDDELLGGEGQDTADFSAAPQPVRVHLANGTALGEGVDALAEIEHLLGSPHGDELKGSAAANTIRGGGGGDVILGFRGADDLRGEGGGDFLHGGAGDDALDGGTGPDVCRSGTISGCEATPNLRDGRDARGRLDVRRVAGPGGGPGLRWTVKTRRAWTTRSIWDRGYVLIWIDARGGPQPDHLAMIRADRGRLLGRLFRVNDGRERQVAKVRAWKAGRRGAAVRVALHKLSVGKARFAYRWSAQTLFTGSRCVRVCLDSAPAPSGMLLQPLP